MIGGPETGLDRCGCTTPAEIGSPALTIAYRRRHRASIKSHSFKCFDESLRPLSHPSGKVRQIKGWEMIRVGATVHIVQTVEDRPTPDSSVRYTMTIHEAAKALGIGLNLAYELAKKGEIPARRLGRRWVVLRQPLEKMMGHDIISIG
ncbi:MAG: helix-turn-helix domain-containing protein [Peptococcaceae bacterium]|jgi:excisionase family DNA binding protein|nr:helix-turn-helix domain-containing protein [Peptococcaceae bacterium]